MTFEHYQWLYVLLVLGGVSLPVLIVGAWIESKANHKPKPMATYYE